MNKRFSLLLFLIGLLYLPKVLGFGDLTSGGIYDLTKLLDGRNRTDVVFIVDVSNGIDERQFLKMRALSAKALNCLGFPKANRLGVVTIAEKPSTILNFNTCSTKDCFRKYFSKIKYSKTNKRAIGEALRSARKLFKKSGRKTATKIIILLVSGTSNRGRDPVRTAGRLRSMGAKLLVLGFGRDAIKNKASFVKLTNSPKDFFEFPNLSQTIPTLDFFVTLACGSKGLSNMGFGG